MTPRIEHLEKKQLIGQRLKMSIAANKTGQLWGQFAPRIKEIAHRASADKISLQTYPLGYFQAFDPQAEFEKWAAVEVTDSSELPEGMETFALNGGLYAVFDFKGSSADPSIFQYIYTEWLPGSGYVLDDRPHFEVLGPKYRNNDPTSEEEIWIPVKEK